MYSDQMLGYKTSSSSDESTGSTSSSRSPSIKSEHCVEVINKPEVYKGALNDMQGLNALRMHRQNLLNRKVTVVKSEKLDELDIVLSSIKMEFDEPKEEQTRAVVLSDKNDSYKGKFVPFKVPSRDKRKEKAIYSVPSKRRDSESRRRSDSTEHKNNKTRRSLPSNRTSNTSYKTEHESRRRSVSTERRKDENSSNTIDSESYRHSDDNKHSQSRHSVSTERRKDENSNRAPNHNTSDSESYYHSDDRKHSQSRQSSPYNNNNNNNNNRSPPTEMNFTPIRKRCLSNDSKLNYRTSSDSLNTPIQMLERFDFNESTSTPPKRPRYPSQSNNTRMPVYNSHQLLGDSQLLRFSEQFLHCRHLLTTTPDTKSRCLGYCVSGQKIADLERRLSEKDYSVEPNVILMIGTNDFIQRTPLPNMYADFTTLLNNLKAKAHRIVILTIPPVPRLGNTDHIKKLQQFNSFLMKHHDGNQVYVVDIASVYIGFDNTAQMVYFEETFGNNSTKIDQIHINSLGFMLLMSVLDILYFNKY